MASTDKAAEYDLPFVDLAYKYLPEELRGAGKKMIMAWAKTGLIQRDRLIEFAMANASGGLYKVVSEDGRDHCDGTDTKTVTVNFRVSNNLRENVIITNISNKVGPLRVVAYDPRKETFRFYFIFNYESVRSYNRIEFDIHSNSKYNNGECGIELSSFEELAQRKW
jgi:hypothetical protein